MGMESEAQTLVLTDDYWLANEEQWELKVGWPVDRRQNSHNYGYDQMLSKQPVTKILAKRVIPFHSRC